MNRYLCSPLRSGAGYACEVCRRPFSIADTGRGEAIRVQQVEKDSGKPVGIAKAFHRKCLDGPEATH